MSLWDEALNQLDSVLFFGEIPDGKNIAAEGVFRHLRRIDYAINRVKKHRFPLPDTLKNILRVGVYLAAIDEEMARELAVNTAVEKAKERGFTKQAGFVNAVLRRLSGNWKNLSTPSPDNFPAYLATLHSYPDFIVARWLERFGRKRAEKLLAAGNRKAPRYFRVNSTLITPDDLYMKMAEEGIEYSLHPKLNNFFQLKDESIKTSDWEYLQKKLVFVQDPAFELASLALNIKPGQSILEIGCAPGGKLLRILELAGASSEIVGVDYSEERMDRVYENLGETDNVTLHIADGRDFNPDRKFDRVLVDPPCSSLGVIRRHPEVKWLRKEEDVKRLAELQRSIAENVMQLVRPGGILVWSTCTTELEENADIVNHILSYGQYEPIRLRHPAFNVFSQGPFIQTLPVEPDYDGAFVAALRRK